MASENDTVVDIVAMLRRFAKGAELPTDEFPSFTSLADHIEAAHSREVAELRRRLKVAEDALAKLQDRFVSSVHDGTIDPYEALKIAEDALAAIREEGGAK